ncbi:MAG: ribosome silencing factor [Thermodesulfobacterium geofontis]|uniref:Ribosomal silencing factor RsfS n=1 Tax=Thermodesulfobacterium geofontis TaxID=1295609 RepID=A0A2N7Q8B4_9BACT|nr:MAG: ribosome silencing factor [Thermodesulfobacterium geofontis]PMP94438.1 MAG: ribosome silencing factor [Thermodesulfobacterium geofontis]
MESEALVKEIVNLLESKKAEEITLIDVRKKVDYADFFIICSAHSTKHTQGICEFISLELEKLGIKPLGIEGLELGQWIVMDYETVILHIFYEPIRKIYALEELWGDLPFRKRQEKLQVPASQE